MQSLTFGPYRFVPSTRTLEVNGCAVALRQAEYRLALVLFQHLGRVLSREHLHEAVWGHPLEGASRKLDLHVSQLRAKLDLRAGNGHLLSAIYGLGYRLETVDVVSLTPFQASPVRIA